MSVAENPDGLQLVHDNADTIGPEEGDGEDGEQPFNPLDVGEMCVFDVDPLDFRDLKHVSICQRDL